MSNFLRLYAKSFLQLIFPQICAGCNQHLQLHEQSICVECINQLPYTNELAAKNYVANQIKALQPVSGVFAMTYYNANSRMESLIHQLKYNNRQDVGEQLGELLAKAVANQIPELDVIIPVPLHPKKEKKRGFNQSVCIAKGLSKELELPILTNAFVRTRNTETQTKKSRIDRFANVSNAFAVIDSEQIKGKRIVLLDDVITTGSTAVTCAEVLFAAGADEVFIAAVAKADLF